jgi:mannosyltransferase
MAWWVGAMTLASLALRLWRINFQSFWLDEAHTAFYINGQSPRVIFERFTRPGENGPVYYLLLLPWREVFGGGEASLRGFSVLAATLAVPVTWLALRRLVGTRDALVTTAFVAFAPYLTWYAQEAKMYALALLAGVTSLWLLMEAIHRGGIWRWVAYGMASLVSVYVHFFALLSISAHAVAAAVLTWPHRRRLGAAWMTIALVLTPVLAWQAIAIGRDVAGSGASMSSGHLTLTARIGILAYAYAMNVTPAPLPLVVFGSVTLAIVGTAVAVGPAVATIRGSGIAATWATGLPDAARGTLALAVLAWSPLIAHTVAMAALGAGLFADRYFVAIVPMIYGLASLALGAVTSRSIIAGAVLGAVVVIAAGRAAIYQVTVLVKDDFRRAMALHRGGKGERDAVVPIPQYLSYPVDYHSPPGLDVVIVDMEKPPVDYAAKFEGRTGVWIIANVPDRYLPLRDLNDWLVAHATLASDDTVTGGVTVKHWLLDGGCDAAPSPDGSWGPPTIERPCVEGLRSTPELLVVRP